MNEIIDKIRTYILENFFFSSDNSDLGDDQSFIGSGVVDSTGILEIVGFLETEFCIKVEDEEMTPENLDSVSRLARFVSQKSGKSVSV
jgi:acyl carrier protein